VVLPPEDVSLVVILPTERGIALKEVVLEPEVPPE